MGLMDMAIEEVKQGIAVVERRLDWNPNDARALLPATLLRWERSMSHWIILSRRSKMVWSMLPG